MKTYYMTKYALSNGGKPTTIAADQVEVSHEINRLWCRSLHSHFDLGKDIFETEEEAKAAILVARDKKIVSLQKQIDKLRKIV